MRTYPTIWMAEVSAAARLWDRLRAASVASYEDNCFGIAKGAAYSSLLAFFPVLTTIATILVQANADAVARTVARLLYDVVPPGSEDIVRAMFNVRGQRPNTLLVVAVLLATWAGSGVMMSLMEGFRAIYRIPDGRPFLRERGVAMMLVFVAAVPALGASALIVFGNRARRAFITWLGLPGGSDLSGWVQLAGQTLTFVIAFAAVVLITMLVYYFGPNRKQKFQALLPGAILATILWLVSTLLFGWYVRHITNYNVLYGSVGAGIALLVWSYVLAVISLFGCEFNAARERLELHIFTMKPLSTTPAVLTPAEVRTLDAWWRAANYLSVGQIYLYGNPLLTEPLTLDHIKPRLLGHWGTTPGLNFIYAHANRLIQKYDLDMIYVCGPGHGGPGMVANTWLEGTYTEFFPNITRDAEGMLRLFTQFSFPGGIPSHDAPETPGSINEGGELGYSLLHAYGAVFDNPDLIACCVIGDGEAETGALATSWHSNKFLDPVHDGAVIPILHLNGYKIAGPTFLARIPREELDQLLTGYGYHPYFVEGHDPEPMHHAMAATLETVVLEIREIQRNARATGSHEHPRWPMIVLVSPKGWTGPKVVDGIQIEGTFRAHQVPLSGLSSNPGHIKLLESWMKSYRREELFDDQGRPVPEVTSLAPKKTRRMGANPHANGGVLLKDLRIPDFRNYAIDVPQPGVTVKEATRITGYLLRDVMRDNAAARNFRVFGPDETASNRLDALFEVTDRELEATILPGDDHISHDGRVLEVLSEHMCQGWLEGYLLTGRHGFFSCYEAFIHIVDSMFNQHAKWLKACLEIPWRAPIASLTYLLTSHVWRQDHNGFSHQDPGFLDVVINKKADVVRVYLPPDANTLLSVVDHCLRSRNYINVIVAGKQPALQYLDIDAAIDHCTAGLGIWSWASNDQGSEPDVVMACCGDIPTLETLAAVDLLRTHLPKLKIRVVNVVDLMTLQPPSEHPHGMADDAFNAIFTTNKPVVFAFHGYPWLIHRLTYRRGFHDNLHVRGYKEEGTTTTPFDMTVMNDIDRFHLAGDVVARVPGLAESAVEFKHMLRNRLIEHKLYVAKHGEDMPEIRDWTWPAASTVTQ